MINIERVKAILCSLSSRSIEELEQYEPIVKNAVNIASRLVCEDAHGDDRAEYFAATKANYDISLASNCDGVTSFSAGDVSISQGSNSHLNAKAMLDDAMKNASDIISDNGFAFLGV